MAASTARWLFAKAGGSSTTTSKRRPSSRNDERRVEDVRGQEVVGVRVEAVADEVVSGQGDGVRVLVHAEDARWRRRAPRSR